MKQRKYAMHGLVLAVGLLVASAASSEESAGAAAGRLVIDPGTFVPIASDGVEEPTQPKSRGLGLKGPRIMLHRPDDDSVFRADEPVSVHVEFLPAADGTEPNMTSLNVKVRKGMFGRDITDDVEPYVDGNTILMEKVDFSGYTGKFRFDISIRDHLDRKSEAKFRVLIKKS